MVINNTVNNTELEKILQVLQDIFNYTEPITKVFLTRVLELAVLFDGKQHDYGSGNISKFGELGVLVRVSDKVERLINLDAKKLHLLTASKEDALPVNESIDDSWKDIAVYAIIAGMVRDGEWN